MVFFLGGKSLGNGKKVQPSGIFRSKKTEAFFWPKAGNLLDAGFVPTITACSMPSILWPMPTQQKVAKLPQLGAGVEEC